MPRIIDLSGRSELLMGVNLIVGDGLCSNIYVIGRKKAVIVDAGVGNYANPVWPQLDKLGIGPEDIAGVVITHAHHDHVSGLFIILERSKPRVYLHGLAAQYVASHIGSNLVIVEDGETIETTLWPLEVIWTPGHTEGEICLYAREKRILLSGDTVFPNGYYGSIPTEGGHSAIEATVNSLEKLTKLDVEVMLPGHGMPVLMDAGDHIKLAYENAAERF